jgi:hypothetical protein
MSARTRRVWYVTPLAEPQIRPGGKRGRAWMGLLRMGSDEQQVIEPRDGVITCPNLLGRRPFRAEGRSERPGSAAGDTDDAGNGVILLRRMPLHELIGQLAHDHYPLESTSIPQAGFMISGTRRVAAIAAMEAFDSRA